MRRITLWALSTLSVLVLLFGYSTSTAGPQETNAPSSIYSGDTAGDSGASTPTEARTFTGSVAQTQWGPVQVRVTVSNGKITDISVPQYPNGNGRDQEINSRALPVLIQETVDSQSAGIDMVSGATVTSDGYVESLQSALDQAGL